MDKDSIRKYLKENLRLNVTDKKIKLLLEGEVISENSLDNETIEGIDMLSCDCCGSRLPDTNFCINCSEPERPVCISCCSCF